ncbi:hypothetical protein GCM10007973_31230 [Polymorphobacter multimanifer]|nr:hypothetical protein GCM10007973_31230 [Polymorphobacter multimanifer]
MRRVSRLNAILWPPCTEFTKRLKNITPRRFAHNKLPSQPAPPKRLKLPQRLNVGHHEVGNGLFVIFIRRQFFFIDQLQARHTPNGSGERTNRPANFKYQQPFWCQCSWIGAKLDRVCSTIEDLR